MAPEVRFEGLRFEMYRGSSLEASGAVAQARMRRDTSAITGEEVEVLFPSAPGREPARLTGQRGVGNAAERWFELTGGVQGEQGAERVDTERARFDGGDGVIRGDAPVTVRGERYTLSGPGFVMDPDARTVRIEGGATLHAGSGAGGGG